MFPLTYFPLDNLILSLNSKSRQEPLKAKHWCWKHTLRLTAQRKLTHNQDRPNPFWTVKSLYSYLLWETRATVLGLNGCMNVPAPQCVHIFVHALFPSQCVWLNYSKYPTVVCDLYRQSTKSDWYHSKKNIQVSHCIFIIHFTFFP